jgi:hypothetical protein
MPRNVLAFEEDPSVGAGRRPIRRVSSSCRPFRDAATPRPRRAGCRMRRPPAVEKRQVPDLQHCSPAGVPRPHRRTAEARSDQSRPTIRRSGFPASRPGPSSPCFAPAHDRDPVRDGEDSDKRCAMKSRSCFVRGRFGDVEESRTSVGARTAVGSSKLRTSARRWRSLRISMRCRRPTAAS